MERPSDLVGATPFLFVAQRQLRKDAKDDHTELEKVAIMGWRLHATLQLLAGVFR